MLSQDDLWFSEWRARELTRIARAGVTYVDYTGAALYPESLVRGDAERLAGTLLANPHSQSTASLAATRDVDAARTALLDFLNADPGEYAVVLTPNASGACRLVGESFPFGAGSVFALSQDNHNSVNGIREFAARRGAAQAVLPLDDELRLHDVWSMIGDAPPGSSLLAFPAQSNFSGVRHPLSLVAEARARGWFVLLDAASYLATSDLDLRVVRPDFVCLSLYKIAGYPTGLGALVVRREALRQLQRPSFAGGTVRWVSVQHQRHRLADGAEGYEDGTVSFLAAGAVPAALAAMRAAGRDRLPRHLACLTDRLLGGMKATRHANGAPGVRVHGPAGTGARGPTLAVSLLDANGAVLPYWDVEEQARAAGIAVRGGCFCNPGCSERAFRFDEGPVLACLEALGDHFTVPAFARCMEGRAVGAIRISLGCGCVMSDVERVLDFIRAVTAASDGACLTAK